ncbi:MAG: N-acetyltransferase [Acidobacteria bacterium]|nr:MAG: N-acetyltransferase [Acidobacteriota bacterium]
MPLISIQQERPDSDAAIQLISELDHYLNELPYTPESRHAFSVERLLRENVVFFVMRYDGEPVACGGIKLFADYAEVKRMYVRPAYRGRGLGKGILNHLGEHALENQLALLRLETGIYQTEAIKVYEAYGFKRRPPFGEYEENPLSLYFEKSIAGKIKTGTL